MEEYELEDSLTSSLDSDRLAEAFVEASDIGFSALAATGALDGIPIFSSLTKIYRGVEAVGAYVFQKKVARFLFGLKSTTAKQRIEFLATLGTMEARREFGEAILFLLTSLDDATKPEICGRIVAAMIRGDCAHDDAFRTIHSVKKAFRSDFLVLKRISKEIENDEDGQPIISDKHLNVTELNALYSYGWTNSPLVSGRSYPNDLRKTIFIIHIQPIAEILLKYGIV